MNTRTRAGLSRRTHARISMQLLDDCARLTALAECDRTWSLYSVAGRVNLAIGQTTDPDFHGFTGDSLRSVLDQFRAELRQREVPRA